MLISKEIKIPLNNRNIKRFIKRYNLDINLKPNDIAIIPIDKLSKNSHFIVEVSCDYCGVILNVPYKRYNLSIVNVNKYSCNNKDCSNRKIKDVCMFKYGVDNPFQTNFVKEKIKNTLLTNYGVSHHMHLNEYKEKIKNTNLNKYGVDSYTKTEEYKEKTKKTNLEKYGHEYIFQSELIKELSKISNMQKYGYTYSSQSPEIREKIEKTNLDRYGVKCNLQSTECKEKIKNTNLNKYGVDNIMKNEDFRKTFNISKDENYIKYISESISLFRCENGHDFEINIDNYYSRLKNNIQLCTICNPINDASSIKEKKLFEFIKSLYKKEIIKNYRDTLEIDIYLPDIKLGFEFNGLYWHSEAYKENNYHSNKTKHFSEKGIRIIHIWEDDWDYYNDIICSQIKNLIGLTENKIFARKCVVKEITDTRLVKHFLDNNHIQGADKSIIKLGLFFENKIVSLMTFNKFEGRKKMPETEWNLSRFCNLLNTNIVGGASKLLNFFIRKYNPSRIISYADMDWSIGNLYNILGFNKIHESKSDYKYIIDKKRVHKQNFKKSKLHLNTNLTEKDYMKTNKIFRIYDCGKIKFEYVIEKTK